jgi:hypothetical protein
VDSKTAVLIRLCIQTDNANSFFGDAALDPNVNQFELYELMEADGKEKVQECAEICG